ncbi:MAG: carbohydrate ABC transporter membrane protein 2 CUT1 family [bacterium]|nr:MAG: carbohydrate ABC transporter membrane protein 2 CUT1 family [bacterium]
MERFSLKSFFVYIALLPLFWMLIIACKQQGQALKLEFLPEPLALTSPYQITVGKTNQVTLQYYSDSAQTVQVRTGFNKDQLVDLNSDRGTFWINFYDIPVGEYDYEFIVDGVVNKSESSNAKPRLQVTTDLASSNIKLKNASWSKNNVVTFRFLGAGLSPVKALLADGREIELTGPDSQGYFIGQIDGLTAGDYSYRFSYARSFWEGIKEIYTYRNFVEILFNRDFPFLKFFLNSLIVATFSGLFTVAFCTMAGYVFAKKAFLGKRVLWGVFLSTMLVPGLIFMLPQFAIVTKLGWINSYVGMIVPHLGNIFGLYLLRQYIETIPDSLFEAAKIDGASEWQLFTKVVVPLSIPIMLTLFLLVFVGQWSNFLWQYITNTPDSAYRTLPVGLALFKGQYDIRWEQMMAGACFSIIPITILFVIAQKFFVQGMTSGGVKE